jgi:hypothetical protein
MAMTAPFCGPIVWEAFLDDLQQTLDKFAVPEAEQAEIASRTFWHVTGVTRAPSDV